MNIGDVLSQKSHETETAPPTEAVREILKKFSEKKIASLVVTNYINRPIGIVTDTTIIKALTVFGAPALDLTANQVMLSPPPICDTSDNIRHIMEEMTKQRVRHFVVEHAGRMVGVVSIGDLVKWRIRDVEMESAVLRDMALFRLQPG